MSNQVIVVGGGLAGLSAAHTVLERGGRVLLLDKNIFMGGNSVKATSGINGALTRTQVRLGIADSVEAFERDTALSASKGASVVCSPLGKVLAGESAPAVEWLGDRFGLDLSLVSRLGGHSFPRTHRGKERFPGMTITYALMQEVERLAQLRSAPVRVVMKARVSRLLREGEDVVGVEYVKDGKTFQAKGAVILATGGYAADFTSNSLLMKYRPDLARLSTTNGAHCTGDGIKLVQGVGGDAVDMEFVQVHPTGLIDPRDPSAQLKFLAAEALRGVGGILLTAEGERFCNELGRRDYVSAEMASHKAPFRLVLNSAAAEAIKWHVEHYIGRGLMKEFASGYDLAKEMGVSGRVLRSTFQQYTQQGRAKKDPFGKEFFPNLPLQMRDTFYVALVCPVVHYTMGGVRVNVDAEVCTSNSPIPGLFAAGEVVGGIHGQNRLGGSSLLDCVVFGRVAGASAAKYLLQRVQGRAAGVSNANGVKIVVDPVTKKLKVEMTWGGRNEKEKEGTKPKEAPPTESVKKAVKKKEYTMAEVAKHNTAKDCWVVVAGEVLDLTSFLEEHPGGSKSILLFAGKDATKEFDMLHQRDVIAKYAADAIVGTVKPRTARL